MADQSWWDKLLGVASDVAPTLATAAGTAAGSPAAGAVLGSLARKLLGDGEAADLDEAARQILGDPEMLQRFRIEARKLELEELRVRTLDVQNARRTLKQSKGAVVVSTVVVIGYFAAMGTVMGMPLPEGSRQLAYLMLGNLATGFGMVLTFWLGSSKGSKDKDQVLARYTEAAQADQQARRKQGAG